MRTALTMGIAAVCVFGGVVHADPAYFVSDSTIDIGDWQLIPAYTRAQNGAVSER